MSSVDAAKLLSTTQLRHPLAIAKCMMAYGEHDEPFEVLARYDPQRPIAKGTFGYVCAAADTQILVEDEEGKPTPRQVAIKKIGGLFNSQRHWVCGIRELQMMVHFEHNNVMKATDLFIPLGEHAHLTMSSIKARKEMFDEVYIVMDMMDQSLRDFIDAQDAVEVEVREVPLAKTTKKIQAHPCTLEHRCYLLFQLLLGMGYLHRSNVMHRDLKPENILIDYSWTAKICDFGQGREVADNAAATTQADCCTQWYAAPESLTLSQEHAESLAVVDHSIFHAVDIWSIGCIAAEMLIGRPLFGEENRGGIPQLRRIVQTMGMPTAEDLKSLARSGDPKAVSEMEVFLKQFGVLPTESQLKGMLVSPLGEENQCEEEVTLILNMLKYNPRERITISSALASPLFAAYIPEGGSIDELLGTPIHFNFTPKEQLQTLTQAKDTIWGLFLERHPEVRELIEALAENERREISRKEKEAAAAKPSE
jgi:serine/threonine protein kinase